MEKTIVVEQNGATVRMTLNRPPANALDLPTSLDLYDVMREVSENAEAQVVLIASASAKIFCAGADVSTVEAHDVALMDRLGKVLKDTFLLMRSMPQIIVAAIGGHCLGGGLELALAADFRLAQDGPAKWGLPEINLGLFPGGGAVAMMSRLVGPQKAFYLALSGQSITVQDAFSWGLADELIAADQFDHRVNEFIEKVSRAPREAVKDLKQAVWRGGEMSLAGAFDFERVMHRDLVVTPDCYEGVEAFKARRAPNFGKGGEGHENRGL